MKDEVSENFILTKPARASAFRLPPSSFPCVPLAVPYWSGGTYRVILRSLISGAIIDGPDLGALKSSLIDRLGVANSELCGSGSLALELALRACGVRHGDEVIIPAFCCSAVVLPILALGAVPVLADIGTELNLTAETVDAAITRKTRAIVVPHLFGNPADIESIVELTTARNILVIDDAAQALGATVDDRAAGSFGDAGIVSFGDEKLCFGLGGGALIRPRSGTISNAASDLPPPRTGPALRKLAATQFHRRWRRWTLPLQSALRRQNRSDPHAPPARYEARGMANLQAAVALSLMHTLDENLAARRARVAAYRDLVSDEEELELIPHRSGSACLTQVVRLRARWNGDDAAARLIAVLGENGYEVQGSYVPIQFLRRFERCVWDALPHTERVWADLVELPCEPSVDMNEIERISSVVKKFCR
jgi:dTDP-4-amino-4,6-dideoxygalactose transaminase